MFLVVTFINYFFCEVFQADLNGLVNVDDKYILTCQ